ncbi:MAG TPA: hypothetical protein VF653_19520, partial [Methylomirabilota bacterium]
MPIQKMTDEQPKQTSLADLRKPIAPDIHMAAVQMSFESFGGFDLIQRAARLLSSSQLVPTIYQGNMSNCAVALEMAQRMGASPLLVMQNLHLIDGRPSWSSQFLIACFNRCGRFSAIRYEWSGERGALDWTCVAYASELKTGERIEGPAISMQMAKAEGWLGRKGSKWQTAPELMLMYRSAAWLVRTHAPEISMGFGTLEEAYDMPPQEVVTVADLRQAAAPVEPEP